MKYQLIIQNQKFPIDDCIKFIIIKKNIMSVFTFFYLNYYQFYLWI